MNYLQRLFAYPGKITGLTKLGSSWRDKLSLAIYYIWFTVKKTLGLKTVFKRSQAVRISAFGRSAKILISGQLDFDVYQDTFLSQEYALVLPEDPSVIVDLGSNIGATVIYFALRYPSAKIYAFEPDPDNLKILRANVSAFGNRVTVIDRAIWSQADQVLKFHQVKGSHWSSSLYARSGETQTTEVMTETLDRFMERHGLNRIDLLKFDIEGAEYEVFESFKRLNDVSVAIGELHPRLMSKTVQEFISLFTDHSSVYRDPILTLTRKKTQ